ncbi:hypothetical protein HJA76_09785 [Rhizobium bangladeshense]|uniref:hypothetical protein n=1 Tax=Rhizobium bangladeshense TaxID=1138189 RepID=UPI001C83442E|nr:hypothetical protein [Rhizobium bangladeshense]MBX4919998.1 hypothetical protein [Rhizobium bangladeshense]
MRVEISVVPDPSDGSRFYKEPELQEHLKALHELLKTAYGKDLHNPIYHIEKSADAGGAWLVGNFLLETAKDLSPIITAGIGLVGGWLAAKAQRKIRVKIGDEEFEAHTVEQVKRLMSIAKEHK